MKTPPASRAVRQFLGTLIARGKAAQKYIVCDKGPQFWCDGFKDWCRRKGIRPRFGAVGERGSIAVVERFIRTMKDRCLRVILVPLRREAFRGELRASSTGLTNTGHTPRWAERLPMRSITTASPPVVFPATSPGRAGPAARPAPRPRAGSRPARRAVELDVTYYRGRRHLPIVSVRRAGDPPSSDVPTALPVRAIALIVALPARRRPRDQTLTALCHSAG